MARTMTEKIWDNHVVHRGESATDQDLLYIDLHLLHEVTSPQAFDGLRLANRRLRRPELTVATADHNVPTKDVDKPIADPVSARQLEVLTENCAEFGITLYPMGDPNQGIVHVIGPELGLTQPGMTIVCGDSRYLHPRSFRRASPSGSERRKSNTSLPPRPLPQSAAQRRWRSTSRANSQTASRPKTSCSRSSDGSEPAVGSDTSSSTAGVGDSLFVSRWKPRMTLCNMSIEAGARTPDSSPRTT